MEHTLAGLDYESKGRGTQSRGMPVESGSSLPANNLITLTASLLGCGATRTLVKWHTVATSLEEERSGVQH